MLKIDRIGIVILFASLSAIAAISFLLFQSQHDDRVADIRGQGVSLVRTLSRVPYEQLAPGGMQQSVLQLLRHSEQDGEFAYAAIVDLAGVPVAEVAAEGILIPAATMPTAPADWLGERTLPLGNVDRQVIEFHAPLIENGAHRGFVRLGYYAPQFGLTVAQLPFLATVALPVFLLVPLFYFLLRLEIRPIKAANRQMSDFMQDNGFNKLEIAATGELGAFMEGFNRFVALAEEKIKNLEENQDQLLTSSKLLTYRKNRVETVLETLPEAVMILDESGNASFANQKMAALFGVSVEDILSKPVSQWCENLDVVNLVNKLQGAGKARNFTETIRFSATSFLSQAIATKTYPLFSPKNPSTSIGTLIVFRDESKEELARQARIDFVSHLSHELKSPLNVLGMYSESLLGEAGQSEEFRIEAANIISTEVERLSALITGLLNMTRIESGSLTPDRNLVRLREVAEAAFDEARHLGAEKGLEFEMQAPNEMDPVFVDKDLIRIALTNLLSNAVKYNQSGGKVSLSVEETEDAIQIRVADTGIGITNEDAARIFEKFYRSEDQAVLDAGGHGIGLSLAKQIIELHHGTLSLNQDRDVGAEFIINLWKESTSIRRAI